MENFLDLKDKAFVISGAGSGIGRDLCHLLYEYGAKIMLIGRNHDKLMKTAESMDDDKHFACPFDLTEFDQIEKHIKEGIERLGAFSGFCHSAGIELTMPIMSMRPEQYMELFRINSIAAFELTRILSKKKYRTPTGASFVFLASIMGSVGRPGLTAYSASKGALISATKSMALELASRNIRVNCVSPGTVLTEMIENMLQNLEADQREKRLNDFPLGIGSPRDVSNVVAFLLSERSKWITGTDIIIDGGYTAK